MIPKNTSKHVNEMERAVESGAAINSGVKTMLSGLFRRFLRNCDGSAMPMLALAALPLMAFVGAAIDYSRTASTRTAMQAALDATGLMLSKDAQTTPGATLAQKASDDFKTMFTRAEAYDVQVTSQFSQPAQGMFSLELTASAKVNTLFSQFLGQSVVQLSATSEVVWGIKKLNLALVLDNTGSMAQSAKMTNLKTAAHNLLTTLQNAAKTPGDVQVAIVPFATDVNAGTSNVSAPWIDWTDWEAANGTCSKSGSTSQERLRRDRNLN